MRPTDIQKFTKKYDPSKSKLLKNGIEIRGVVEIEKAINRANEIIDRHGLNLIVVNTAEMASYGAFEVREAV
ncbi:hypothetical protein [Pedobacter duraquae]|uniref:Uncharacterized protein n=1 Tax=Pedobacter duraquae TaxID=425511 RepID=A0A4V3C3F7_9SPHI|nr:hypothetical protein [Pedobacter duraquae]TDO21918.1 hypothetical protein CLV32_3026 [Pedobacter duraquae]